MADIRSIRDPLISEASVSSSGYFCKKTEKNARTMSTEEVEAMTDTFAAGAERFCRAEVCENDGIEKPVGRLMRNLSKMQREILKEGNAWIIFY